MCLVPQFYVWHLVLHFITGFTSGAPALCLVSGFTSGAPVLSLLSGSTVGAPVFPF